MKKIGIGRKMAFFGFAAQSVAMLLLGIAILFGQKAANIVGVPAGILTGAGFFVAMGGFFLMYYARKRKQHLAIGFLMLVYFLVNFMFPDPTLIQLLLSLAYTGVMVVYSAKEKNRRVTIMTGAALVLYAVVPMTLGRIGLPDMAVGVISSLTSAYCFAAAAMYGYTG